jgi:hypothetical protein
MHYHWIHKPRCDILLCTAQPWWAGSATTYTLGKLLIAASPVGFNPAVSLDAPPSGPLFYFKGKMDEVCESVRAVCYRYDETVCAVVTAAYTRDRPSLPPSLPSSLPHSLSLSETLY